MVKKGERERRGTRIQEEVFREEGGKGKGREVRLRKRDSEKIVRGMINGKEVMRKISRIWAYGKDMEQVGR